MGGTGFVPLSDDKHTLPFSVRRNDRQSLTDQVFEGLRKSILSGAFRAGDVLPSRTALAVALNVSEIVTREACVRLAKAGLVNPRPGVGSVVLAHNEKLWRGRVLYVAAAGDGSYHANVQGGALRDELAKSGYLVVRSTVARRNGCFDFRLLDRMLEDRFDLVVIVHGNDPIARHVSAAGAPFIVVQDHPCALVGCRGVVRVGQQAATPDVIARCRAVGVRRVLVSWAWQCPDATLRAISEGGMVAEKLPVSFLGTDATPEDVQRAGMERFLEWFGGARTTKPDLVWFPDDDYLASGALTAFLALGVRIPEDVRVVTLSNRGLGPVFTKSLSRIEVDPRAYGQRLAGFVQDALSRGGVPDGASLGSVLVLGETF